MFCFVLGFWFPHKRENIFLFLCLTYATYCVPQFRPLSCKGQLLFFPPVGQTPLYMFSSNDWDQIPDTCNLKDRFTLAPGFSRFCPGLLGSKKQHGARWWKGTVDKAVQPMAAGWGGGTRWGENTPLQVVCPVTHGPPQHIQRELTSGFTL